MSSGSYPVSSASSPVRGMPAVLWAERWRSGSGAGEGGVSRRRADCLPTHNLQRLMSPRTGGHPPSPRSPTNIAGAIAYEAWWCLPLERLLSPPPPNKRGTGSDRCCCARGFAIVLGVNFGRELAERALAGEARPLGRGRQAGVQAGEGGDLRRGDGIRLGHFGGAEVPMVICEKGNGRVRKANQNYRKMDGQRKQHLEPHASTRISGPAHPGQSPRPITRAHRGAVQLAPSPGLGRMELVDLA